MKLKHCYLFSVKRVIDGGIHTMYYIPVLPEASWVSVSSMAGIEEDILPDDQKTAFDWCKDGKLDPMKEVISQSKMDINEPDDEGLWCGFMLFIILLLKMEIH